MSCPRHIFIVPLEEMAEIGERFDVHSFMNYQDALARITARQIMECLPPIGYVRLYDAFIDKKICYAFMIGARNAPLDEASRIIIEQFNGLFNQQPDEFTQGEERRTWYSEGRKLRLVAIILTRRRDKLTEYE